MGHSKSSSDREVHTITDLPKEARKISNNNLTLHLKELEKEQQIEPNSVEERKY